MTPTWQSGDGSIRLVHGDCLEVLPELEEGSVSLVCMDPPYNGTLSEEWDNQWKTDSHFLGWLGKVLEATKPPMADNASLYCFASPRMAARVEGVISEQFNVLSSIVWCKGDSRQGVAGSGIDVTALRRFWPGTERVVFAEQYGSDATADVEAGYTTSCEAAKRGIFGEYLKTEFQRAKVTQREVAALFPSATGGLTGCVSNWLLGYNQPTAEQYEAMRTLLNGRNGGDYLRREYDYLRREYEDLRRPFNLTKNQQWGDVWRFAIERNRIHPAQKPVAMMEQVVAVSSRSGDTVLEPFGGSFTTAIACIRTGRKFIGIEIDRTYFDIAVRRIEAELQQRRLFV